MVLNRRKHDIIYHYTEGKHRKSLHFSAFTHINLTRKCIFLAANSGEYIVVHSENANAK